MAMRKTPHPSTVRSKDRKSPRSTVKAKFGYRSIKDLMAWRSMRPTQDYIKAVANALWEWVEDPEAMDIYTEFLPWFGMPRKTYDDWVANYPIMTETVEQITLILGGRRERAARHKEQDAKVIMKTLSHYHPVWQKQQERDENFRRELATKEEEKSQSVTVVIPPITSDE